MADKIKFINRIRTSVGGDSLSQTYYRFLAVHTGFLIFTGLPSVFINTFLMSQTSSMDVVLLYNVLNFAGTALGMFLSAAIVHWFNAGISSVLGILGYSLLYLQLIILNTQASDYVFLLGTTGGLAGAFYWISYSELLTEYTDLQNRDSGMAIVSIMSAVVNLVVPLLAGSAISAVGRSLGYNLVFGLAFGIGIVTAVGAIRLPKPNESKIKVHHKETFRLVAREKMLWFCLLSESCKGIREGAFSFILSILLYKLISSEALIGFNTFLSSGISILSFLIISKHIMGTNRLKYMEIAVASLFLFSVFTVFTINPVILILFTVVNAFFTGFIGNSSFANFLDAVQILPKAKVLRPELFAQKELYLATGRCFGVFIILLVDRLSGGSMVWQAISLVILTVTQVGTIAASRRATHLVEQRKKESLLA